MSRTIERPSRNAKKSYTLSLEALAFLEEIRKERRASSISAALEDLIREVRRAHERAAVERAVAHYYGSRSNEEAAEEGRWGDFALGEFSKRGRR